LQKFHGKSKNRKAKGLDAQGDKNNKPQ
jgi:hypothetical protein